MIRLLPIRISLLLLVVMTATVQLSAATITIDDSTVVAPASSFGVGINGGSSWYQPLSANLVDNPCFEGPADGNGISQSGWSWFVISGGAFTASVDQTTFTSGAQSQKVVVSGAPFTMEQGHYSIFQAPISMQLTAL